MSHRIIEKARRAGGLFPTVFDIGEMWRLNQSRCGGRFNLFFFWMYPALAVFLAPYTVLCLIQAALKADD